MPSRQRLPSDQPGIGPQQSRRRAGRSHPAEPVGPGAQCDEPAVGIGQQLRPGPGLLHSAGRDLGDQGRPDGHGAGRPGVNQRWLQPDRAGVQRDHRLRRHHGGRSGPAAFIFDSESGQITAWNPTADPVAAGASTATLEYSSPTAVYKGLAIAATDQGTFLYAANFNSGAVDVFNSSFQLVNLLGSFSDPRMPRLRPVRDPGDQRAPLRDVCQAGRREARRRGLAAASSTYSRRTASW